MTEHLHEVVDRLADDDELVLQCIEEDLDDVNLITQATFLNRDKVDHRFKKLAGELEYFEFELIEIERQEGMVDREVNGTRQVFPAPKTADLTDLGRRVLAELEENRIEEYRSLSRDELAEKVVSLEDDLDELTRDFESFRGQVQDYVFD